MKHIWQLAKQSVSAWIDDFAPSMGAALAYYTVFSIAPLLLIVIAVAGMVFGREAVQGEVVAQLGGLLGPEGATAVEGLLKGASKPSSGIIASVVSFVTLLIGATTVFGELQSDLDRIWEVPAREKISGLWKILRAKLLSFGMVLATGFLLLVSLVVSAAVAAFGKWWGSFFGGWEVLLQIVNVLISLALSTGMFAMIYKLMPRAKIEWHDVWIGAVVTAILFEVGKFLIGLYLGKSGVASAFGAAGSVVLILVWVYYSAQIFLLGAEFTWIYAREHGSHAGARAQEEAAQKSADPTTRPAPKSAGGTRPGPKSIDVKRPEREHAAAVTPSISRSEAPVRDGVRPSRREEAGARKWLMSALAFGGGWLMGRSLPQRARFRR
jgi:membrane protein